MSLVQHVSAVEGTDRQTPGETDRSHSVYTPGHDNDNNNNKSVRQVLSYDAFPSERAEVPLKEEHGGVTPYNVPVAKRIGTFLFRFIPTVYCLSFF